MCLTSSLSLSLSLPLACGITVICGMHCCLNPLPPSPPWPKPKQPLCLTFDEGKRSTTHALLEEDRDVKLVGNGANGRRHADSIRRHSGRHVEAVIVSNEEKRGIVRERKWRRRGVRGRKGRKEGDVRESGLERKAIRERKAERRDIISD